MALNMTHEVVALQRMSVAELRSRYAKIFGERPRSGHRQWLLRRIAWRLQALAYGDFSQRARARALELANDADLRLTPPRTDPFTSTNGTPRTAPLIAADPFSTTISTAADSRSKLWRVPTVAASTRAKPLAAE